ncbi:hypothetical protein [Natrarchaeobaculum sulfurireducens]|uniref:hypothetical protein n=1 Tax=Natrarchaeobaculum sulfurireducens TaxID=2044521 RepID=UPI00105AB073|nr:hypothetical protein [Natrarchaeobaculum sulfurireducens]
MTDLERELRYAKEALAIVESKHESNIVQHPTLDAQAELLPREFQYMVELSPNQLRSHVSRLSDDIEDRNGGWL